MRALPVDARRRHEDVCGVSDPLKARRGVRVYEMKAAVGGPRVSRYFVARCEVAPPIWHDGSVLPEPWDRIAAACQAQLDGQLIRAGYLPHAATFAGPYRNLTVDAEMDERRAAA